MVVLSRLNTRLPGTAHTIPGTAHTIDDDLSREVFGLLGLAVDAITFEVLLRSIYTASQIGAPYLISTPNVNFLVNSRKNSRFRESLLRSDLCIADGMPLIWISRFLRVPIRERVTGADLFDTLKRGLDAPRRLRVFLLGGAEGVASVVAEKLNTSSAGLRCVGALCPGFGSIDEMSSSHIIDAINSSGADLLAVFLGAEKAQTWLLQNHHRIKVPLRAQFGAAINFEAGTVQRAPRLLQNSGFEWLWRIKEEPCLWRRYWNDGQALLRMFLTRVLPLAGCVLLARLSRVPKRFQITVYEGEREAVIALTGPATSQYIKEARNAFRSALHLDKDILLDCSGMSWIDPRFFGLILMMRKHLLDRHLELRLRHATWAIRRLFHLNGFEFLLEKLPN